ncbi:hypothetical protein F444_04110 [Phytophthora nicotianae P1976]|uniref:UBA domain-containing protein n=1 Tax=Phytophthora nicotianae P1976 TaxID=1317066 RepID=A0A081ART8_PHYNI|nr:hypothetical protein F444_04110 [Phytophthora nicotianae P1976]
MLVLRVRCADDGRELLIERNGAAEYSIQVAELKQLILQQRQQLYRSEASGTMSNPQISDLLEDCFVLLRGQILADPDVVDLNALRPSDFFVFAPDSPQSGIDRNSSSAMHTSQIDSATFELLRSQLVDMGFSTELATQALRQCDNNLSDAAALLAEGKLRKESSKNGLADEEKTGVVPQNPSIAPLRSLLYDKNETKLRELAAMDSFQALLLLKENFSSEMLNQLNENPVATLRLLSLPAPAMRTEMEPFSEDVIDVDDPNVGMGVTDSKNAVDRLVAMGFSRDLVEVMYESCGGDEQLTANALLQTLES